MPELNIMTAIKTLDGLKEKAEKNRACLLSNVPEMKLDDKAFSTIMDSINAFSKISTDILDVARVLRKGE
jgi:hypothetical protein